MLYQWNDFTLSLDNTYFGSALDDVGQEPDGYSLNSIGSMNYLDVQARYRFNDRFEIYGGIDNITDEDPPYCPSCKNEPGPGSHFTLALSSIEFAGQHVLVRWYKKTWFHAVTGITLSEPGLCCPAFSLASSCRKRRCFRLP